VRQGLIPVSIPKLLACMHRVGPDELCCARGKGKQLAEISPSKDILAYFLQKKRLLTKLVEIRNPSSILYIDK